MLVATINAPEAEHLAEVVALMQAMGAPKLRAIFDPAAGVLLALEGSHRIAAAVELGIAPEFEIVEDDDMLTCEDLGYDDMGWFDGEPARAADIGDRVSGGGNYAGCPVYTFSD
jgi:hypothetical protein